MSKRSNERPRLLTAGYVTLDIIVRDLGAHDYWHAAGGTCGNVSVFASALGMDVSILARIGEDQRGQRLLGGLTAAGVDTDRIEQLACLCTLGVVELVRGTSEGGHRFTFRCPVCGTQLPKAAVVSKRQADMEVKCINEFDAFFFDRATSATMRLAEAARQAGLLVVFEPTSIPRTAWAERAVALNDIVKISQRPGHRRGTWQPTRNESTQFIVETLGALGTGVRSRSPRGWGAWNELPADLQSHIRDTAGAGDWLTAGLITSLLSQPDTLTIDTVRAAIEYGQRLSAISLAFDGPSGALTALGASIIEQIARSTLPIQVPSLLGRPAQPPQGSRTPWLAHYCELCLTPNPPNRGDVRPPERAKRCSS